MDQEKKEIIRYGCMRSLLRFIMLANIAAGIFNLLSLNENVTLSTATILIGSGINFLNALFAYFLLNFKKIGFYGICINAVTAIIINTSVGLPIHLAALSLLNPILVYLMIRPYWKQLQ